MNLKEPLWLENFIMKGQCSGFLFLGLVLAYSLRSIDHNLACWSLLPAGIGFILLLLTNRQLKFTACNSAIAASLWNHIVDECQLLRPLSLLDKPFLYLMMLFCLGQFATGLYILYGFEVAHMSLHSLVNSIPFLVVDHCLSLLCAIAHPGASLLLLIGGYTYLLSKKWQRIAIGATSESESFNALSKLITFELYCGNTVKANNYSHLLLQRATAEATTAK
jgi:hypothetical protein